MVAWWFVPVSILVLAARILGQPSTKDFISIDCGFNESSSYKDQTTGLTYSSDNGFIDSGVNHKIDLYALKQLKSLRSFPNGTRNCYSFTNFELGTKLLIRAAFFYGNYDGKNSVKSNDGLSFDLWLGTKFWTTMNLTEIGNVITEVITVIATKYLWVCLVNTGHGTPFISALELRPLDSKLYPTASESQPLILMGRWDYGSSAFWPTRYPQDPYDRFWLRPTGTSCLTPIRTDENIGNQADDLFQVPSSVMQTAVIPCDNQDTLSIYWDAATYGTDIYYEYHFFIHFADFQQGSTRVFQTYINGDLIGESYPRNRQDGHIVSVNPYREAAYNITLQKTSDSLLPPLLNAMEIYQVTAKSEVATNSKDVDALMLVKEQYRVKKNWTGDPCAPQESTWDGVNCYNYTNSGTPRVIYLNLSSSGLRGRIHFSLAKLDAITSLDLSNNSLEGEIPDFLAALPSLQLLNLTDNNLTGPIPLDLLSKLQNGLILSVKGNPGLCTNTSSYLPNDSLEGNPGVCTNTSSDLPDDSVEGNPGMCTHTSSCGQSHCTNWGSCGRKKKIILSLSIVSVVLVVGLVLCVWRLGSKKSTSSVVIVCQEYTYNELEKITKNFDKELGSGGFGTVYYGTLKSGTEVAVKKVSEKSEQATRGFLAEVQILTRAHHANLVHLVGYWRDGANLALVYEYMAGGSLQEHLSGKGANARFLNWIERLQIALRAAQGLDYLHVGCMPPVVHRDVKTSNILLNEKLEAKVADFGLSKVFRSGTQTHISMETIGGTAGYVDPEYNTTRKLSQKSDVYSFGVVLLELITGLPALLENSEVESLVDWVELKLKSGGVTDIVDSRLENYCIESMTKFVELAKTCTEDTRIKRPSMSDVVVELKESLKLATRESFPVECPEAPFLRAE